MADPNARLWPRYLGWMPALPILLGGLWLAFGVLVRHTVVESRALDARFATSGVKADGWVVDTRSRRVRKVEVGNRHEMEVKFSVDYEFADAGGAVHRGSSPISEADFRRLKERDAIRVEFLRDEPATNRLARDRAGDGDLVSLGWALLGLGAVVEAVGVAWLAVELARAVRRARVVRCGEPLLGSVDEVEVHPQTGRPPRYLLSYRFWDREGDESDGWTWLPARLRERWQPGEPILVLWDGRPDSHPEPDIYEARAADLARLREEACPERGSPPRKGRTRKVTRPRPRGRPAVDDGNSPAST